MLEVDTIRQNFKCDLKSWSASNYGQWHHNYEPLLNCRQIVVEPHSVNDTIEGDFKKARQTEFDDYIGDFAYGFYLWYTSHIFHYNWM